MAEYMIQSESLTAVANAIRERAGTSEPLVFPEGFKSAVEGISSFEDFLVAMNNCTVTEVTSSALTGTLRRNLFEGNTELQTVDLPNITKIGERCLYRCSSLKTINLPKVAEVGTGSFCDNTGMTSYYLPSLETVSGDNAFSYNHYVEKMDFPKLEAVGSEMFANNVRMTAFLLRGNFVCSLPYTSAFNNTPIAGNTAATDGVLGYIYVPAALVDSYKAATNWSAYASQFRALEDYTVDGTTTGELDESKT